MLASSGNVVVGLSMLVCLSDSDLPAFLASQKSFQDVHLAETALQISELHFTAGDMRGANRYASVARAIAGLVGADSVLGEAADLYRRTESALREPELAARPPLR